MPEANTERIKRETEEFSAVVTTVRELMDAGNITAKVLPLDDIELEYEIGQLSRTLELKGIELDRFESLAGVISSLLTGLFMLGSHEDVVRRLIKRGKQEAKEEAKEAGKEGAYDEETERQIIDANLSAIESQLMTPEIRSDYLVKKTSKKDYFSKLRWEVNEKRFDGSEDMAQRVFFATLSLELRKTVGDGARQIYSRIRESDTTSVVFDVSLQDARELCGILGKIVSMMENAQKAEESD